MSDHSSIVAPGWEAFVDGQFCMPYYQKLRGFIQSRRADGATILPLSSAFEAFKITNLPDVKVVIIGQEPYPNKRHSTGLAFGVPAMTDLPRVLSNICDEVDRNLAELPEKKIVPRSSVTFEGWARQGVLMLNSVLTAEDGVVGAHQNQGWEIFTNNVLYALSQRRKPLVVLMWGAAAMEKRSVILPNGAVSTPNLAVFGATHPSPLSYNRGPYEDRFRGCRHFLLANQRLKLWGLPEIDWSIVS
jgi:uracil-DNA glycosylase